MSDVTYRRAIYKFEKTRDDMMSLEVDQIIEVHSEQGQWGTGRILSPDIVGVFPISYTEPVALSDEQKTLYGLGDDEKSASEEPATDEAASLREEVQRLKAMCKAQQETISRLENSAKAGTNHAPASPSANSGSAKVEFVLTHDESFADVQAYCKILEAKVKTLDDEIVGLRAQLAVLQNVPSASSNTQAVLEDSVRSLEALYQSLMAATKDDVKGLYDRTQSEQHLAKLEALISAQNISSDMSKELVRFQNESRRHARLAETMQRELAMLKEKFASLENEEVDAKRARILLGSS